jgi:ATP-dependent Clp protease ATP-binding subunit ClpB
MQFQKFTIKAQEAVQSAQELASSRQHPSLEPLHLLLALVQQDEGVVPALLQKLGIQPGALAQQIESSLSKRPTVQGAQLALDPELDRAFREALSEMEKLGDQFISTEHLLLALLERKGSKELLSAAGLNRDALHQALQAVRGSHSVTGAREVRDRPDREGPAGQARPGHRRDEEIRRACRCSPAHEEQPGAHRRARRRQDRDRRGLAQRIVHGDVPRGIKRQADHGARCRRAARGRQVPRRVRGAPEGRAQGVTASDGRGDPVHRRAAHRSSAPGGRGRVSAGNLLKPALARGELRCIGATTLDEYRKHVEKDPRSSAASSRSSSTSPTSRRRSRSCAG